MAEGDTILRVARRIERAIGGERVTVGSSHPRGRAAGVERFDGRRLERVEARGKHLLLHFGDLVLHSHLGMSGSWRVYRRGAPWGKPASGAWVALRSERNEAVQFGGPTLRLISSSQARHDPRLASLGPDILATEFEPVAAVRSLRRRPDRELGDALLDQGLIAGIGNIFKSEACFAAGVSPWRTVEEVSDEELEEVVTAANRLMRKSVERDRPERAVYRRAGRPCPRCGTPIAAMAQGDASRRTYWCPRCQPPGDQVPASGESRAK